MHHLATQESNVTTIKFKLIATTQLSIKIKTYRTSITGSGPSLSLDSLWILLLGESGPSSAESNPSSTALKIVRRNKFSMLRSYFKQSNSQNTYNQVEKKKLCMKNDETKY